MTFIRFPLKRDHVLQKENAPFLAGKQQAMKKILVPTDFSVYADKAMDFAAAVAQKAGAELVLVHIYDALDYSFADRRALINEYNDAMAAELQHKLDACKSRVANSGYKNVKTILCDGDSDTIGALLTVIDDSNPDLVVMGTLGATGLRTAIQGTKTTAVIARCSVPVVTIPFNYEWKELKKILIATNDADEDAKRFEPVFELGRLFDAEVRAVAFSDARAEAVEMVEHSRTIPKIQAKLQTFSNTHVHVEHLTARDFHQAIQQYIEKDRIDLLVMITHKRGFIQSLFRASMTRQMAYHTNIPLLALHGAPL
jgi:nucleotide-binding universal stress UspA family protein